MTKNRSPPFRPTQTTDWCGLPSGWRVATVTKTGESSTPANFSDMVAGFLAESFAVSFTVSFADSFTVSFAGMRVGLT
ncbi:hypothetical protein GCM10010341_74050 [Streptomyces noursei]|nr:hypothetical protein GCM10010341_74050 [Streptomyces noursei]